ncbi:hypothetical protein [Deinococcus wulumuqiensis]|nr:hypothetical protein [Deinococcus wulumuqiensis]QII20991.1 hypothetical protein G6R31_09675 [Deinococcus wulumuqiensis R12]
MTLPLMLLALLLGGGQAAPTPKPDAELATLRARYLGKEVWVYGGGPLRCSLKNPQASGTLSVPYTGTVRVLNVERLTGTFPVAPVKSSGVMPARPVKNPLRLRLGLPKDFRVESLSYSGTEEVTLTDASTCREVTETYVDGADLEKNFSLTPPDAITRQALAPFFKPDPQKPASEIGLTHTQVLWLRGIPESPVGDLKTLLKAPVWLWNGLPGRGDNVLHFQNDRVVKVEVPRMGP